MDKQMCRVCLKIKPRIKEPADRPGRRGHVYRNEVGKRWHGMKCYECHLQDAKTRFAQYYKSGTSSSLEVKRKCRECGGDLEKDRYFKHKTCDYAYHAGQYAGSSGFNSVWTPEDWGCGVVDGLRF